MYYVNLFAYVGEFRHSQLPEASSQTLRTGCNYSTVWSSSSCAAQRSKGWNHCCLPNGEVTGRVIHYSLQTASLKRKCDQEEPHMMSHGGAESALLGFPSFARKSSCTAKETCMLMGTASSCSSLRAFHHGVSRLFRLRENASCHVLCIRFQFSFTFVSSLSDAARLGLQLLYLTAYRFHTFAAEARALGGRRWTRFSSAVMKCDTDAARRWKCVWMQLMRV